MPIQVPPDSTGKVVRTMTDSGTQEQQTVTIGDGTNITNVAALADMDTGVGTELALNVSLRKSASGGSVEYGTATAPIRVDTVGTTVQPVSAASLPLPAGAATEAGNLASIKAKTDNIPALGQALAAASVPVVLTAAQVTTLTPPAAITNFANETGGNLASIKAKTDNIPALGQALAAASVPVVMTSAQLSTLTPLTSVAVTNAGTFAVQATGTLTDNNAAPSTTNIASLVGIARTDYRGGTAATAGRAVMPDVGTDGLLHVAMLPDISIKRYRASSKFAASSTTENWRISGNASNTTLVTWLSLSCTQTTAGQINVEVVKHSAAASGGTAGTPTIVPMDSNKGAASSVVNSYTGTGPTIGASVGDVDNMQVGCMAAATATPNDIYIGNFRTAPIVLRGVAEGLALNVGNAALTGGNLTITVEWMEVTTVTP